MACLLKHCGGFSSSTYSLHSLGTPQRLGEVEDFLPEFPKRLPNNLEILIPDFIPLLLHLLSEITSFPEFSYLLPLESDPVCVTFKAKITDIPPKCKDLSLNIGDIVVVKFASRYGEEVHRFLAKAGFAPTVYYCGKVPEWEWSVKALQPVPNQGLDYGSSIMVVMAFVENQDGLIQADNLNNLKAQQVAKILCLLLRAGFVFGDLRPPNILFNGKHVVLIDFNWAGRFKPGTSSLEGVPELIKTKLDFAQPPSPSQGQWAQFPLSVNSSLFSGEDLGLELILPQHDTFVIATQRK